MKKIIFLLLIAAGLMAKDTMVCTAEYGENAITSEVITLGASSRKLVYVFTDNLEFVYVANRSNKIYRLKKTVYKGNIMYVSKDNRVVFSPLGKTSALFIEGNFVFKYNKCTNKTGAKR